MAKSNNNLKIVMKYQRTQECLQLFLKMSQWFGVLPLQNLDYPAIVSFKWFSWKIIYGILLAFTCLVSCTLAFFKAVDSEGLFSYQMISPLFNLSVCLVILAFLQIATRWPDVLQYITEVENEFSKKYPQKYDLHRKIRWTIFVLLGIALGEHALSVANFLFSTNCTNRYTGVEFYFRKHFHYIFYYVKYDFILGLFLAVVSWISAYIWNFGDIFIIVISIILTERFRQIIERVTEHIISKTDNDKFIRVYRSDESNTNLEFWKDIHVDYNRTCQMCRLFDKLMSNIVLVSYSCNLIFILLQLFLSLRKMDHTIEIVYFYYSFIMTIVRTILVSIHGGLMNDESKALLPVLSSVSTFQYNDHMKRLMNQIYYENIALTGHNFFRITKGLVLNVAATIITYELVLIQFNQEALEKFGSRRENSSSLCL